MIIHMTNKTLKTKQWDKLNATEKKYYEDQLKMMLVGGFIYRAYPNIVTIEHSEENGKHVILASADTKNLIVILDMMDKAHNAKEEKENGTEDC